MDDIVCANTAFRYWRCPPQVRDLYPRLPNAEDNWRALSQAPFVVDVLKTPVITAASTRSNLHSETRRTIRWNSAYTEKVSIDTGMGFSVTDPLNTLFTMTRSVPSKHIRQRLNTAVEFSSENRRSENLLRRYRHRKSNNNEGCDYRTSRRGYPWIGRRA